MAQLQPASIALDGGDPRLNNVGEGVRTYTTTEYKGIHDPSVSFEEYLHYAKISRLDEKHFVDGPGTALTAIIGLRKKEGSNPVVHTIDEKQSADEKEKSDSPVQGQSALAVVSDEEWRVAGRAARTATWGAIFYLITTDILGPSSVPWAMSRMGYGPGVALYTVFGALAGYTGWQLWRMFIGLDSTRYPLRTYGDIAFRVYGSWARHGVDVLQSIQLVFNVGIIVLANGQGLSQVAKGKVCFSVLCVIWTVLGAILGQIRTLQRLGWIANLAIWLNFLMLFMTMGVVANSEPNFDAALSQNEIPRGPIVTTAGPASDAAFNDQIVGLMQAVYSYGGSMLFCEFMAEMRRPMDFWKGMLCAQVVIYVAYLFFGLFVYSFQGQFTINPANQGISTFSWQTTTNVIGFVSSLIAAALYGNIGIKVLYQNVIRDLLGVPDLNSKTGKLLWVGMVPVYWSLAFIIASAIPQFSNIGSLVAAVCILQFTYTFPPLLMLGYDIKRGAMLPGDGFDPVTGQVTRVDSGTKRWIRGFMVKWHVNIWNSVFFLGSCVTAVLGIYSSVLGLRAGFAGAHAASSFGCKNPVG